MRFWQWAEFGGIEIGHVGRTSAYLRAGLGGPYWSEFTCTSGGGGGSGYIDEYVDLYGDDPAFTSSNCACDLIDAGPYASPADDPAPWYDAAVPASGEFLGYVPDVVVRSMLARNATPRASGGASLSAPYARARGVEFRGVIVAGSGRGMAYGESWLRRVLLGGPSVGPCADDVLRVLPACPPADDLAPEGSFRDLHIVGLTDPPEFSAPFDRGNYVAQSVAFQMTAGSPWLRRDTLLAVLNTGGPSVQQVEILAKNNADAAAVIAIKSGPSTLDGLRVRARLGSCAFPAQELFLIQTVDMPANATLSIDGARQEIRLVDTATQSPLPGQSAYTAIDFSGLIEWPVTPPGQRLCITVDSTAAAGNAGSTVSVTQADLEA